jgi:hypothetical protein
MGTSSDRTVGSGGTWTPLKYATSSYLRGIRSGSPNTRAYAERVLARHVPVMGGSERAAAGARAGRTGVSRLGGLLSGVATGGLASALTEAGLAQLIGADRFSVLDALVTYLAGDGNDLDSQAARDAACDVVDEIFGDAETWEELTDAAAEAVTRETLTALLQAFLVRYVYNRVPVIAERLSRLPDAAAVRRADEEMRQIIAALVALRIPEDPFSVDWSGEQGREIARDAVALTYEAVTALEAGDQ